MTKEAQKLTDLTRLLNDRQASKALTTPQGSVSLSPGHVLGAQQTAVAEYQGKYAHQFTGYEPTALPDWAHNPWLDINPVSNTVQLKSGMRDKLKELGLADEDILKIEHKFSSNLGAYKNTGSFVEGLPKGNTPTDITGGVPKKGTPEAQLAQFDKNKTALFNQVANSLASAADPYEKAAIVREAFFRAGPEQGSKLLDEFGNWAQITDQASQAEVQKQIQEAQTQGPRHPLGQLLEAIGQPGNLARGLIGEVENKFFGGNAKDAQGNRITAGTLVEDLKNLGKGGLNLLTLGNISQIPEIAQSLGHPHLAEELRGLTQQNLKGQVGAGEIAPFIKDLMHSKQHHAIGSLLSFGLGMATDPLTYASFGAGSLGKEGAADLLKGAVGRLVAKAGGSEAEAAGAAFKVAQEYGGRVNFQAATKALEDLGYNPAAFTEQFPRVGFGRAASAATQARGGVTLKAGIPGTDIRGAVNILTGGSKLERVLPTRVVGTLLDHMGAAGEQVRTGFGLADKLSRNGLPAEFKRQNPEISNEVTGVVREAHGKEHRAVNLAVNTFRAAKISMTRIAKQAKMSDEELHAAANDLIELGKDSPHFDELVSKVGQKKADEFLSHAQHVNEGFAKLRQAALDQGVPIPELTDQAAGSLNYLTHGLTDAERQIMAVRSGIKVGSAGKAKRALQEGASILNPATGERVATSGTLNDINEIYNRIMGTQMFNSDPFQQSEVYARAVGRAIRDDSIQKGLEARGLGTTLEDDIANRYRGIIKDPAQIRYVYTQPLNKARQDVASLEAQIKVGERDTAAAARAYAAVRPEKIRTVAEIQHLRTLRDSNSHMVDVITKSAGEKKNLMNTALTMYHHELSIFAPERDAELRALREAGALPEVLKATSRKWEAYRRSAQADYERIRNLLQAAPDGLRKRAEVHLRSLAPEAFSVLRGGSGRPYTAVLADAIDSWDTIEKIGQVQKYGDGNLFNALSKLGEDTEFGQVRRKAVELSQTLGDLEGRIANETKAGRLETAGQLSAQRDELLPQVEALTNQVAAHPEWQGLVQDFLDALSPDARTQLETMAQFPVDELIVLQNEAARAGNVKEAGKLAEHVSGVRNLGHQLLLSQQFQEAQQAIRDLAEQGLRTDKISGELVRGLKEHLASTLNELEQMTKAGRAEWGSARRAQQGLQARYLREVGDQASVFVDDWAREDQYLTDALGKSFTLHEQIMRKQRTLRDLVGQGKLKAIELQKAQQGLENLQLEHVDAVAKLLSQPEVIDSMVPHISHLGMIVNKLPGTGKSMALPADVYMAISNLSKPSNVNSFQRMLTTFTNAWKRGTLAIPGSSGRRMFGEFINATFMGGLQPNELVEGITYARRFRGLKGDLGNADSTLREMVDQNIFEGRWADVYGEAGVQSEQFRGMFGNKIAPLKRSQHYMFEGNAAGEDALRAGLFLHARKMGMSPAGARAYVGKYLFFHDEISPLERNVLRNVFPFWTYLRNNAQFQLYSLFQTPGKISAYNTLVNSLSAPQETPFGPESVYQQGGFPTRFHNEKGQQEVFYPGTFDIPQGLTMIPNLFDAVRYIFNPNQNNPVFQDVNPLVGAGLAAQFGKNIYTGQDYGTTREPFDIGPLHTTMTARERAVLEQIFPQFRQTEQLTAANPSRKEASIENLISLLVGPTVRPITVRGQSADAQQIAKALASMNQQGLPQEVTNPNGETRQLQARDVTAKAKKQRERATLQEALKRLTG